MKESQTSSVTRAFPLFLAQVCRQFLGLAVGMVLVRTLTMQAYGTYAHVLLVTNMALPVAAMGLADSLYFFAPRTPRSHRRGLLVRSAIFVCITTAATGFALCALRHPLAHLLNDEQLVQIILPIVAILTFTVLAGLLNAWFIATERIGLAAIYTLVQFLPLGIASVAVWQLDLPLEWLVSKWAWFGMMLLIPIIIWPWVEPGSASIAFVWPDIRRQLSYALPMALAMLSFQWAARIDQLVASVYFNRATFALYQRGAMQVPFLSRLCATTFDVALPRYSTLFKAGAINDLISQWQSTVRQLAPLIFGTAGATFLFADQLFVLAFTEQYAASASVFRYYVLSLPFAVAMYSPLLRAAGLPTTVWLTSLPRLIITSTLGYILVPHLSLIGPAIAVLVGVVLTNAVQLVVVCRCLDVHIAALLPWRTLAYCGAATLLVCLIVSPLRNLALSPVLVLLLGGGSYAALYGAAELLRRRLSSAIQSSEESL